jgi:putative transposase
MAQQYPLKDVCQALRVPRSAYYAWRRRVPGPRARENQILRKALGELFVVNRQVYGSPRLTICLQRQGIACSRNRVARHMQALRLKARQKRAFRPKTTDSRHPHPIAPNRLGQRPKVQASRLGQ